MPLNWTNSDWEQWFTDEVEPTDRWQRFSEHASTKSSGENLKSDELAMDVDWGGVEWDVDATAAHLYFLRTDKGKGREFSAMMRVSPYAEIFSHLEQEKREAFLEAWTRLMASDERIAQAEWATPSPEDLVSLPGALGGPMDPEAEGNRATAEEIDELLKVPVNDGAADSGMPGSTNPENWTDTEWHDWYDTEVDPGWRSLHVRIGEEHDTGGPQDSEGDPLSYSDAYPPEILSDFMEIQHHRELEPLDEFRMASAFLKLSKESRIRFYENWQKAFGAAAASPAAPAAAGTSELSSSKVNRALVLAGGLGAIAVVAVLIVLFSGGDPTPEASAPDSVPPLVAVVAEAGCEDSSDCTEEEVEVIEEAIDDLECTAGSDCDLEDVEELIEVLTNCPDGMQVDDARYVDSTGDAETDERQANTAAADIECTGYSQGSHIFTMVVVGDGETMSMAETTSWYNPRFVINTDPETGQAVDEVSFSVDVRWRIDGSLSTGILSASFGKAPDAIIEAEWLDESTLVVTVVIPDVEFTVKRFHIELSVRTHDADGNVTGSFGDLASWELES